MDWLPWIPLIAAALHITEEFAWPGGFPQWYRRYRHDASHPITNRFLVLVNGALLVACLNIGSLGRTSIGLAYWLTISAVLFANGIWHQWAAWKTRTYSPGMLTGLLLYIPLGFYGYNQFVHTRTVSIEAALFAYSVGGSYHLWSALFHKRGRANTPATSSSSL